MNMHGLGEAFTAADIIRDNARHFPDAPAFIFDGRECTNSDLLARSASLAAALEKRGIMPGDRVAVLSRNCIEFFEVYAAGFLGGATIATVNYRLALPEMAYVIEDCRPTVLIFEDHFDELAAQLAAMDNSLEHFICIGEASAWAESYEALVQECLGNEPAMTPEADGAAVLIYTSGTTGRPKGCVHSHQGLWHMAQIMGRQQPAPLHDKMLLVMPMFHLGGLGIGLAHLGLTGTIVVMREFDADLVLRKIEEYRIGLILLAPAMVQMLLDSDLCQEVDTSSLHTLMYSASPMPSNTLRAGIARFGSVFMQYFGQTEVIASYLPKSLHKPDGSAEEQALLLSAGIPQPGIRLKIVGEDGRELPAGHAGEIMAQTRCSAVGYWNNPEATAETFGSGWTAMGDIGRIDERGFLFIVDRKKDVIISGGENIYSREVEEAVLQHPGIAEVAVVGQPDERWGESVCAFVILKKGVAVREDEVIETARKFIASYKKPKRVIFLDDLPKLISGKVDKKSLRAKLSELNTPS